MDRLTDIIKYRENNDQEALIRIINNETDRIELSIERYKDIGIEKEDLRSIAILTIIKIAKTYDYEKYGNKFFRSRVDNGINKMFEDLAKKQLKKEQYLKDKQQENKFNAKTDIFNDDTFNKYIENITNKELLNALEILKERQRKIIILRYGLVDGIERTQEEIAEILGGTLQSIDNAEKSACEKLRRQKRNKLKYLLK